MALGLGTTSCRCVNCDDDDMEVVDEDSIVWEDNVMVFRERVLSLLANDAELHVATESEFVRFTMSEDTTLTELERRPLIRQYANSGQPALHPLVFARSIKDIGSGEELVQFSLVQNSGGTRQISIDSLSAVPMTAVFGGEVVGAFNRTGTVYLQPVYRRDKRNLALMRFELRTNSTFTEFTSIRFTGLIDFPNVRESQRAYSTIKFLDGNFYLATKQGAYLIDNAGNAERIIAPTADIRDFFRYEGIYYATQSTAGPLFESQDGLAWTPSGIVSDLKMVNVFGNDIVSHELEGWKWRVSEGVEAQAKPLKLNDDFPLGNDMYFDIVTMRRQFYMSVDRRIVRSAGLVTNN